MARCQFHISYMIINSTVLEIDEYKFLKSCDFWGCQMVDR